MADIRRPAARRYIAAHPDHDDQVGDESRVVVVVGVMAITMGATFMPPRANPGGSSGEGG